MQIARFVWRTKREGARSPRSGWIARCIGYSNRCFAEAAGVSVQFEGDCWSGSRCVERSGCCEGNDCGRWASVERCEAAHASCERYCGGWVGDTCRDDELCDFADDSGVCRPRPDGCPEPGGVPVCGCDGVTYLGERAAHFAGTDVAFERACE